MRSETNRSLSWEVRDRGPNITPKRASVGAGIHVTPKSTNEGLEQHKYF